MSSLNNLIVYDKKSQGFFDTYYRFDWDSLATYARNDLKDLNVLSGDEKFIYGLALINCGEQSKGIELINKGLLESPPSRSLVEAFKAHLGIGIKMLQDQIANAETVRWSVAQKGSHATENQQFRLDDLIVLIPTCKVNEHKSQAVRVTWAANLREIGGRYLFVIGEPTITSPNIVGDVLYVPARDDYESLLVKLALAYEYVLDKFKPGYILKMDDDCFVNVNKVFFGRLNEVIGNDYVGFDICKKNTKFNNQWHVGKCKSKKFENRYAVSSVRFSYAKGGYGYFLSNRAARMVADDLSSYVNDLDQYRYSYEDMRIGEVLFDRKIEPVQLSMANVSRFNSAFDSSVDVYFDLNSFAQYMKIDSFL